VICGLRGCAEVARVNDCFGGVDFHEDLAWAFVEVPMLFEEADAGILEADALIVGVLGVCGAETTF
jgi:hypothetical protein